MLENYDFIEDRVLAYFRRRLDQAPRDADFALDYVKRHDFKFFGIYRIVLGAIVLAVAAITALA